MKLFLLSFLAVFLKTTVTSDDVFSENCEIKKLSECSQSCGGGYIFYKWTCKTDSENCAICPTQLLIYQCNNRPCLTPNATLQQIFDDAEDQQEEMSSIEYYE